MDKFQNKYRIASARWQNWDYGDNAAYFVTICTQNRQCYFGEIVETPNLGVLEPDHPTPICNDFTIKLSESGKIAQQCWVDIPNHFPFVKSDEFIVMPNHIHGIIIIDRPLNTGMPVETPDFKETPRLGVSTIERRTFNASHKWERGTLGVIINQYKRVVTIQARKMNPGFAWQTRFHDHVIRNDESYARIVQYMTNNPAHWPNDQFFQ